MSRRANLLVVLAALMGIVASHSLYAATVVTGTILTDQEWTPAKAPYVLSGVVTVAKDATLTIQAGVDVHVKPLSRLDVYGTLDAEGTGTPTGQIAFERSTPIVQDKGYWQGIRFIGSSTNNAVKGCNISYARVGLRFMADPATPANHVGPYSGLIEDTTIQNCALAGVRIDDDLTIAPTTVNSFGGNTIADCGGPAVLLGRGAQLNFTDVSTYARNNVRYNGVTLSGALDEYGDPGEYFLNTDWTLQKIGGPYFIKNTLTIAQGVTLTIEAGTELRFDAGGALRAYGTLAASAEVTAPIIFTSSDPAPQPGDWSGLDFANDGTNSSILNYCQVLYAGSEEGAVHVDNEGTVPKPKIQNTLIDQSRTYGVMVSGPASSPSLSGVTITRCGGAAIRLENSAKPNVVGKVTWGTGSLKNGFDGTELAPVFICDATATLYTVCSPYRASVLAVPTAGKLTVQPGVTVQFRPAGVLRCDGTITAVASKTNPVRFTSEKTSPSRGDWQGIQLNAGASGSQLTYCEVLYAGQRDAALKLVGTASAPTLCTATIKNTTIQNSARIGLYAINSKPYLATLTIKDCNGAGIVLDGNAFPTVTGTVFVLQGNRPNAIVVKGLSLTIPAGTSTLRKLGDTGVSYPYIFTCPVLLPTTAVLVIEPGVNLQFSGPNEYMDVKGILQANGTAALPITFQAQAESPLSYQWGGLRFNGSTAGYGWMKHCIVRAAEYAAVSVSGTSNTKPEFTGCSFVDSIVGLWVWGDSKPVIRQCTITRNLDMGVLIQGTASPNLGDDTNTASTPINEDASNDLTGNLGLALRNETSGAIWANSNWWGATTIPGIKAVMYSTPPGSVNYAPWLSAPPVPSSPARLAGVGAPLRITAAIAQPARRGGAMIAYGLSAPASVQATVFNVAGRLIKTLPTQSGVAGVQQMVWDGRSNMGTKVPAGRYLVVLRACEKKGEQMQRLLPLSVR